VYRGRYFELLGAVVGSAGVVVAPEVVPEVKFDGDLQPTACCDLVGVARSTPRQPNSYQWVNHEPLAVEDRSGDKLRPYQESWRGAMLVPKSVHKADIPPNPQNIPTSHTESENLKLQPLPIPGCPQELSGALEAGHAQLLYSVDTDPGVTHEIPGESAFAGEAPI
jgi:hypothetical protein